MTIYEARRLGRITVLVERVERALTRTGLPDIDYALNPYSGCSHGCIYCYARLYVSDARVRENWGSVVAARVNIHRVLERETRRLSPGLVGVGTVTDPYQPVESLFRLTRRSLEVLLSRGFRASIQTKNPMVLRDLDILESRREFVDVGFTITTLDWSVSKTIEPHAPPPLARVRALEELSRRGVETWVFYGPVIPGVNDDPETARSIAEVAARTGSVLYVDPLRVKPFMLSEEHPLREAALRARSRKWLRELHETVARLCREYGLECREGFTASPL
ncbi:MAG: radical SAM protein [Acidilobaceae archaeon]